jgi:hypothetical protein
LRIGCWQTQVHFVELGPRGGEHQKNEDDQQNINERNQIDVGLSWETLFKFQGLLAGR